MKRSSLALALLLSACVSDASKLSFPEGHYRDYRDLLVNVGRQARFPNDTPAPVRERYAQCSADYVLSLISPADLPELDAYARGSEPMTVGETKRIDAEIQAKGGRPLTEGGLERLTPFCPADVPDFQKWPPHN